MQAIYDLGKMPTTFDFAAWGVIARTNGATSVHFIVDGPIAGWKYPPAVAWKRFGTIVIPLCALAGLDFTVGGRIEGAQFGYDYGAVEKLYRATGRIAKLKATSSVDPGYMTITLRKSFRNTFRNSNTEAWQRFKTYLEGLGHLVVMLPECEQAPLDVEYRMALYANADMNFGASNGPLVLCHLSDAPYLTMNMCPEDRTGTAQYDLRAHMIKTGFAPGSQFSFRNQNQLLVWKADTFANIVQAWESMKAPA